MIPLMIEFPKLNNPYRWKLGGTNPNSATQLVFYQTKIIFKNFINVLFEFFIGKEEVDAK